MDWGHLSVIIDILHLELRKSLSYSSLSTYCDYFFSYCKLCAVHHCFALSCTGWHPILCESVISFHLNIFLCDYYFAAFSGGNFPLLCDFSLIIFVSFGNIKLCVFLSGPFFLNDFFYLSVNVNNKITSGFFISHLVNLVCPDINDKVMKVSTNFSKMRYSKNILPSHCTAVVKNLFWLIIIFYEHDKCSEGPKTENGTLGSILVVLSTEERPPP